jgi:hypothetical protein
MSAVQRHEFRGSLKRFDFRLHATGADEHNALSPKNILPITTSRVYKRRYGPPG